MRREPTQKQTEARRKNFNKMFILGNLYRARANVAPARSIDPAKVARVQELINQPITETREFL